MEPLQRNNHMVQKHLAEVKQSSSLVVKQFMSLAVKWSSSLAVKRFTSLAVEQSSSLVVKRFTS